MVRRNEDWFSGYAWGLTGERIPSCADSDRQPPDDWIDGWEAGHDKWAGAKKAEALDRAQAAVEGVIGSPDYWRDMDAKRE